MIRLAALIAAAALTPSLHALPPLREQATIQQEWLKLRLERTLPALMRKHGVEMWLVVCREYNEDPVFFSLVSPTTMAARRRTIYLFHDRGPDKGVDRLALGGTSQGGLYEAVREADAPGRELYLDAQWDLLRKTIEARDPGKIAVNISRNHAFADGLTAGEREALEAAVGPKYLKRFVRAEDLALEFVETRLPEQLPVYRELTAIVHSLIARAFSNEVITPGKTTDADVIWWFRHQIAAMGLGTWFHPSVSIQRAAQDANPVIQRGDVLHCDFGIMAMRLNTDTQHMGYVLKEGESEPPPGIRAALANANKLQDIVLAALRPGRTGNEVLMDSLDRMKTAGINGSVYSHPIGDHGHGAGPLIGLWDRQQPIPGRGDPKVIPDSWFSIELAARTPVPEWGGKELFVGQEEDAAVGSDGKAAWVLRRQTAYHLVH